MAVTRIGLQVPNFTFAGVADRDLFERLAAIAVVAEESGFDSLWVMDHYYQIPGVGPRTEPMFESYTTLGAVAARTRTVSLGTLVTGVTYRNPALLAKIVTTLDVISGGRAILGIGAAWNDDEHAGYGFSFPPTARAAGPARARRSRSAGRCSPSTRRASPAATTRSTTPSTTPGPCRPAASRSSSAAPASFAPSRSSPRYADACNVFGDVPTIRRKLDVLARHCEAAGRDPATITKTRLGGLVIAATDAEADRKGREMAAAQGMDEARYRAYVVAGGPDSVCEQVGAYLDAGLDGMVFNMDDARRPRLRPPRRSDPHASLRREGRDDPRARQLTGDALVARAVAGPCRGAR